MATNPVRADKVKPEAVEWLWKERIPRAMISIVGGRPDQGKGMFCAHLAAEVSRTRYVDPASGKQRWGRVLYSAIEDSHSIMTQPRLQAAGANLNRIDLWRFRLPLMFEELEHHLKAKPVDLLVIDPLASHLTNGVSRHSDNIRLVTDPLSELIERTRTAVVVVEHVLKRVPASGMPIAAIGGSSSGIVPASRMAYLFGVDPGDDDRRILACVKHNICEKPQEIAFELDTEEVGDVGSVPFLLYDDEVRFDPWRFLDVRREGRTGRPPDKRAAAAEWLTNYLYGRYRAGNLKVPVGKIVEDAKHYGMTSKTLRNARKDMDVVLDPPGGGRNCTWELSDELISVLNEANGVNVDTDEGPGDAEGPVDGEPMLKDEDFNALLGGEKDNEADNEV